MWGLGIYWYKLLVMKHVFRFWQIIVIDILGFIFMIAALLTGWLPGPGGIPLFLIGLGLFALNHDWAKQHIDLVKKYADHIGDLVFIDKPRVQLAYDIITPIIITGGILLLMEHANFWILWLGFFLTFLGVTILLANRHRYRNLKRRITKK